MLGMVQGAWRRFEQAVAASRRREARRLIEQIEDRRREMVRRAAGRIGIY
jgi:hypothetical protein